jgi:hypothetical protein
MKSEENIRREARWEAIELFVSEMGGWVVSRLHSFPMRVECRPDSEIPKQLAARGYKLANSGSTQRFLPVGDQLVLGPIDIWELRLP